MPPHSTARNSPDACQTSDTSRATAAGGAAGAPRAGGRGVREVDPDVRHGADGQRGLAPGVGGREGVDAGGAVGAVVTDRLTS